MDKALEQRFRNAAKERQVGGELEVDDDAEVSMDDNPTGAYVQAWIWVELEDEND